MNSMLNFINLSSAIITFVGSSWPQRCYRLFLAYCDFCVFVFWFRQVKKLSEKRRNWVSPAFWVRPVTDIHISSEVAQQFLYHFVFFGFPKQCTCALMHTYFCYAGIQQEQTYLEAVVHSLMERNHCWFLQNAFTFTTGKPTSNQYV